VTPTTSPAFDKSRRLLPPRLALKAVEFTAARHFLA
jgi:hypothetical protein